MKKKTKPTTRITLDLSPEFYDRLDDLEKRVGAESKAKVLREALRLYEHVMNHHLDGDEFFTRKKGGELEKIILLR